MSAANSQPIDSSGYLVEGCSVRKAFLKTLLNGLHRQTERERENEMLKSAEDWVSVFFLLRAGHIPHLSSLGKLDSFLWRALPFS